MSKIAQRSERKENHDTRLTHVDEDGRPSMVDVSHKEPSRRTATAHGRIYIPKVAYDLILTPAVHQEDDLLEVRSENDEMYLRKTKARSKGDVLTVAQLAGIMASKRTADLIPLCHTVPLSHISVVLSAEKHAGSPTPLNNGVENFNESDNWGYSIRCCATAICDGKTGVEMEALTAVSVSLLTVWDMLKAVAGMEMIIGSVCVTEKTGGKSGDFVRDVE